MGADHWCRWINWDESKVVIQFGWIGLCQRGEDDDVNRLVNCQLSIIMQCISGCVIGLYIMWLLSTVFWMQWISSLSQLRLCLHVLRVERTRLVSNSINTGLEGAVAPGGWIWTRHKLLASPEERFQGTTWFPLRLRVSLAYLHILVDSDHQIWWRIVDPISRMI